MQLQKFNLTTKQKEVLTPMLQIKEIGQTIRPKFEAMQLDIKTFCRCRKCQHTQSIYPMLLHLLEEHNLSIDKALNSLYLV